MTSSPWRGATPGSPHAAAGGEYQLPAHLNHSLVIYGLGWVAGDGIATAAVWVLLSVAISAVTYRFVERPAIGAGRRIVAPRRSDTAHAGAASKA